MVERVFWHIGLPKTGTTYLQQILWSNGPALAADGFTFPGGGHRRHLWAALDLQQRPKLAGRHPDAPGSWDRLNEELDNNGGTGLLSHEFFCGATAEQAAAGLQRLAPAEVHLVITARDAHGMLTAGWQEQVKNGSQRTVREAAENSGTNEFSWQTWDLHGVLERFTAELPADRVHVIPMPGRAEPADMLWRRFSEVLGLRAAYELPEQSMNRSLGVVQVELLRRVNAHLGDFRSFFDRGRWIRGELAEGLLSRQTSQRFGVDPDILDDCRQRSERAVALIEQRGFRVHGDVRSLLVPDDLGSRRLASSVTDAELLDASGDLVADLLGRIRELTDLPGPPDRAGAARRLVRWLVRRPIG